MKDFNMKQWLIENRSGMYSKTAINEAYEEEGTTADQTQNRDDLQEMDPAALGAPQAAADAKMQVQDDESDDVVSEAKGPRGVDTVKEVEMDIEGVPYIIDSEVYYQLDEEGDLEDYTIEIKELGKAVEDEYVPVTDPAEKARIQNYLNSGWKNADKILKHVDMSNAEYDHDDSYEDEDRYDETVGYVMKTKSPEDKQYFPGSARR